LVFGFKNILIKRSSGALFLLKMIFEDDKPHDHCGVFGIFSPQEDVARLTFYGLLALQHRGQESAGIATADLKKIKCFKSMGLVSQVFTESKIRKLKGKLAIGHNRYSTAGSSILKNAQPIVLSSAIGDFALVHNGNLANDRELKKLLFQKGHCFNTNVDSEIIARLMADSQGKNFREKIKRGIPQLKGAFSLLFLTKNKLFVIRDPWGIRPLILGKINSEGWLVASESVAIESIGGRVLREVKPGEMLQISQRGLEKIGQLKSKTTGFCIFEYVYFSRPDSVINGRLVHRARMKAGQLLACQNPVKADMVISVPDSGTSAALGFAQTSKIPFQEGLIKSRYVGRTFIQPSKRIRNLGVRLKFNTLSGVLKGKKVVVVDDSIVRGTTILQLVEMIRRAGAKKVHLRIVSPPFKNICYLGVDVKRYKELIARKRTVAQIQKKLKADSLAYLSLRNLKRAIGQIGINLCTGCFSGDYPV
jgi:amidophosphoribosyltransferase